MPLSEVVIELPFEPWVFGAAALALLLVLLVATLAFGGGRPHV
jgi:hypothetical protein